MAIQLVGNEHYIAPDETQNLTIVAVANDRGQANNTIVTGSGNDTINAGPGNDNITAGPGDDLITGGDGNDKFYFNFAYDSPPPVETIYDFMSWEGRPSVNANLKAWNNAYTQWQAMVTELAAAENVEIVWGDFENTTLAVNNVRGSLTQTFSAQQTSVTLIETLPPVLTGEGYDVITDFTRGTGGSNDALYLVGLTQDQAEADIDVSLGSNGTVLDWGSGSITLNGNSADDWASLINSGGIVFA